MRKITGGFVLCLCVPVMAAAQQTVSLEDHTRTVRELRESRQLQFDTQTALKNAKLQQLATIVSLNSQGKSRLLLGSGVSANPQRGRVLRMMGWGNDAFFTLYPTSAPRNVQLAELGEVQILGAVNLLVGARPAGSKSHCEAGQYLLALRTSVNGMQTISLLTAKVDEGGQLHYQEALAVPAEPIKTEKPLPSPAMAAFPREEASKEHPAWQVKVELPAINSRVRFYLDMDITML